MCTAVRKQADEVDGVVGKGRLDVIEALARPGAAVLQRNVHQPRTLPPAVYISNVEALTSTTSRC